MSLEHPDAEDWGDPVPGGVGGPPVAFGEAWGWELTQRDWSLRARESWAGAGVVGRLVARTRGVIARLWRRVRSAPRGNETRDGAHDIAR
jgi:hypothetical protein